MLGLKLNHVSNNGTRTPGAMVFAMQDKRAPVLTRAEQSQKIAYIYI